MLLFWLAEEALSMSAPWQVTPSDTFTRWLCQRHVQICSISLDVIPFTHHSFTESCPYVFQSPISRAVLFFSTATTYALSALLIIGDTVFSLITVSYRRWHPWRASNLSVPYRKSTVRFDLGTLSCYTFGQWLHFNLVQAAWRRGFNPYPPKVHVFLPLAKHELYILLPPYLRNNVTKVILIASSSKCRFTTYCDRLLMTTALFTLVNDLVIPQASREKWYYLRHTYTLLRLETNIPRYTPDLF